MSIRLGDAVLETGVDMTGLTAGLSQAQQSVTRSFTSLGRHATTSLRDLGRGAVFLGGSLTAVGLAGKRMFTDVILGASAFETQIANAAAVSGGLELGIEQTKEQLSELALELSGTVIPSAEEVAKVLVDLSQRGFDAVGLSAEQIRPILQLSTATLENQETATAAVTTAMKVYGLTMGESERVTDVFTKSAVATAGTLSFMSTAFGLVGPVASQMGVSLEELTGTFGFLSDRGIRATTAGQSIRRILASLNAPSSDLEDVLTKLGLTMEDVDTKSLGLVGAMENLRDAGIDETQVFQLFDKVAASSALAILGIGESADASVGEIKRLTRAIEESGGITDEVANVQLDTFAGKWELVRNAVQNTFVTIQQTVGPVMEPLLEKVREVVKGLQSWITTNKEVVTSIAKDLVQSVSDIIDRSTSWIKNNQELVLQIGEFIAKFSLFSIVAGPVILVLGGLVAGFAGFLGSITSLASFLPVVTGSVATLATPLGLVATALSAATLLLIGDGSMSDGLKILKDTAVSTFNSILNGILSMKAGFDSGVQLIGEDTELLNVSLFNIGVTAKDTANFWVSSWQKMTESVRSGLDQSNFFINENMTWWERLDVKVITVLSSIVDNFKQETELLGEFANIAFNTIMEDITAILMSFRQSLINLWSSIWNGMKNQFNLFVGDMKAAVANFVASIQELIAPIGDFIGGGVFNVVNAITPGQSLAGGGVVNSPLQVVNEKGGEIAALPNGSTVIPHDISKMIAGGMGGGVTINMTGDVSIRSDEDIKMLAKELSDQASRASRRRGVTG